jgi:adenylyltransferase/sulfurtransferase
MATRVLIPTALRPFTGRNESVDIEATTVGELLDRLTEQYQELRRHLYSESGRLRNFVNVYVNDEDIRHLEKLQTRLEGSEVISIIPSIAGGSRRPGE